jgi:ubiquinone/menaquinone biosynthesis C-methylase UbiE
MKTDQLEHDEVRNMVRDRYGKIAAGTDCGCGSTEGPTNGGCCGSGLGAKDITATLGYSADQASAAPAGANLGLGCGNPLAIASLTPGQTVLDLGSGAGFDAFLAAHAVGPSGRVIGVDMTPEMIAKARKNQTKGSYTNVEFRLGEIEHLPLADASVDVIISNCVINLSPDKGQVLRETFRVLRPGGRLAVADIVRTAELPSEVSADLTAHCGCVAGAASVDEIEIILREAGFTAIRIQAKDASRNFIRSWIPRQNAADYIVSSTIEAVKPKTVCCSSGRQILHRWSREPAVSAGLNA